MLLVGSFPQFFKLSRCSGWTNMAKVILKYIKIISSSRHYHNSITAERIFANCEKVCGKKKRKKMCTRDDHHLKLITQW